MSFARTFAHRRTDVVRDHLRSATPVGVMMSGGLDSSSVAATAARLLKPQGKRVVAFTQVPRAGFDGPVPNGCYSSGPSQECATTLI
jgi:asparagine synthase (glutamine-hydrolysing)